jgi:hypothetical protein
MIDIEEGDLDQDHMTGKEEAEGEAVLQMRGITSAKETITTTKKVIKKVKANSSTKSQKLGKDTLVVLLIKYNRNKRSQKDKEELSCQQKLEESTSLLSNLKKCWKN